VKEKSFYTKLVGVTRKNEDGTSRQELIEEYCSPGDLLVAVPEPDNPDDRSAVKVCLNDGQQLGYLNRSVAREVFDAIAADRGVEIEVKDVTGGGDDEYFGTNVQITILPVGVKGRGGKILDPQWVQYAERYRAMTPEQRGEAWDGLALEQQEALREVLDTPSVRKRPSSCSCLALFALLVVATLIVIVLYL
jgi:hypothetical protein